eukprot:CAMPEP_0183754624 /NCGR_PEP_ID=MMETSP0739-20130205/3633_1 /TAXON_ID=385413 /ORGANISM="Thalassiosira miniscula, Strain CCMP1093" /LENGTH=131 /DNA_ID=CAMNT_0025991257 /DNA_START=286 /DNA_END=681 /DNA_ORIENTATION=-
MQNIRAKRHQYSWRHTFKAVSESIDQSAAAKHEDSESSESDNFRFLLKEDDMHLTNKQDIPIIEQDDQDEYPCIGDVIIAMIPEAVDQSTLNYSVRDNFGFLVKETKLVPVEVTNIGRDAEHFIEGTFVGA